MDAKTLRERQAPIKESYRADPASAIHQLRSTAELLLDAPSCRLPTPYGEVVAGMHPGCGGDGSEACSANMLLDALVGCAGVTLGSVSRAMHLNVSFARFTATGTIDFRGTLAIDREAPIGFKEIELRLEIACDADETQLDKMQELTERYCVVYQTLKPALPIHFETKRVPSPAS